MTELTQLERTDELVRQLSHEEDPDRIIRVFAGHDQHALPRDGVVSLSRRGLAAPQYRVTRSNLWKQAINPWQQPEKLPIFDRGIFGELLYAGRPAIIDDLQVGADDPAREYLDGIHSLACAPTYDHGQALNMVILLRRQPASFKPSELETVLLNANLVSRAVTNALLAGELREAYQKLDREMQRVGEMQRQLLPRSLPAIEGLQLAAQYATCSRAGGDYYDVFRLDNSHWGLCIADVSGHGTPAAVVMAMLHTLLRTFTGTPLAPGRILSHVNRHMTEMVPDGTFATAIYGVYDVRRRTLRYSNAGHPFPRCRRGGEILSLAQDGSLPLGLSAQEAWEEREFQLERDDALLFFTDGLTEGMNHAGEQFGSLRLESALRGSPGGADAVMQHLDSRYLEFCDGTIAMDDRTLLVTVAEG
jgi:sigma-B regulation protein RsbU (phosphoserine phosphatase)